MELVKHEIQVPKESKEVIDLLSAIADHVIAKKPFAELANLIDEAYIALQGVDQVPAEVKSASKGAIIAYLVEKIGQKF